MRLQPLCEEHILQSTSSPLKDSIPASYLDHNTGRLCEDQRFVFRHFLEPICDLCVLKEHKEVMALYTEDPLNGEGLVWSSEVQIEIDPAPRDSVSLSRLSGPNNGRSLVYTPSPSRRHRNIDTPFSDGDADDEGSLCAPSPLLPDIRGRPRSRTKRFRRRGIDLSRDELRISSRWDHAEKQSMEDFRSAIKEKANADSRDGLFKLWNGKNTSRSKDTKNLKSIVKDLRSSVSRGRRRLVTPDVVMSEPSAESNEVRNESRGAYEVPLQLPVSTSQQPKPMLRRVRSSISLRRLKLVEDACTLQSPNLYLRESKDSSLESAVLNWRQHLEQDLQPVTTEKRSRKKGIYLLQDDSGPNNPPLSIRSRAVLPSDYFPDHSIAVQQASRSLSRLRPSATVSELSERQVESYWRLPSLSVSASYSYDLSSPDISSGHSRPQKSGITMNSREFDSAWWKDTTTARNMSSASSQPVTIIASRSTSTFSGSTNADAEHAQAAKSSITEMVAALKLKLTADFDRYEAITARPLLQPSVSQPFHETEHVDRVSREESQRQRAIGHTLQSVAIERKLVPSVSLPNTCTPFQTRYTDAWIDDDRDGLDIAEDDEVRRQWLALH